MRIATQIGSRRWYGLEIDLRNFLVEENALVGHAHRKRDRELRVNDSEVPCGSGDSSLTTGVDVVHARDFRGGSYGTPEVNGPKLAHRSDEFPIRALRRALPG